MLLLLIGELVLVIPDRSIVVVESNSKEDTTYGLKPETNVEGKEYFLWSVSCYSVFTIPINTVLIAGGLRLVFCKLHVELLKSMLIIILLFTYLSTLLGLIGYILALQEDSDVFK